MTELARGRGLRGIVTEFDAHRGLGAVTDADGVVYKFHCIEIADGSRDIAVDVGVTFDVLPKLGRYEAANIRP